MSIGIAAIKAMKKHAVSVSWSRKQLPPSPSRSQRVVASLLLVFFGLQVIRSSYILTPNQLFCPEQLKEPTAGSAHDHHHEGTDLNSPSESSGYSLEHCKETVWGIALTPVQPFGLPLTTTVAPPEVQRTSGPSEAIAFLQHSLPPPFQPPRA